MHNARNGRFDPHAIKGLVKAFSLYPIGSMIELSDGNHAIVLRSNSEDPAIPSFGCMIPAFPLLT